MMQKIWTADKGQTTQSISMHISVVMVPHFGPDLDTESRFSSSLFFSLFFFGGGG